MRKINLIAVTAAMFAACTSNDNLETQAPQSPVSQQLAVGFDAYTQRGVTRAGVAGTLTDTNFKDGTSALSLAGFGVFGYYTDLNEYDQLYTPDFMYNQQVTYNTTSSAWEYTPVKYWPNEYGNSAISDDVDKVSFFAYAPWVTVTPTSGKVNSTENTWGIAGLSKNSATGDPIVKYITSFDPAYTVDLCWGVANGEVWNKTNGGSQTMTAGMPWLNVERPADYVGAAPLRFTFKHALTQLQVKIDAAVDDIATSAALATKTKIYVRSISFTGIAAKGALNLNNADPDKALWLNFNGTDELDSGDEVVVYDGLKDGKEGTGQVATNEKSLGLNPVIISDNGNTQLGVTATPVDLLANGTAFVIPSGEPMTVKITYDVETEDDNLAGYLSDGSKHGSSIQNVISKEVHFTPNDYLENGKKYILNLHLGMNSVKFDATVTDWDPTAIEKDVDLPSNLPHFVAGSPATNSAVTLPWDMTSYSFIVNGLGNAEPLNTIPDGTVVTAYTTTDGASNPNVSNASGSALVALTIAQNATPSNKVTANAVSVAGATTTNSVILKITQAYHPLGLSATAINNAAKTITLASDAAVTTWPTSTNTADPEYITITKTPLGGAATALTYNATPSAANEFSINTGNGLITLNDAFNVGDTYAITVKVGDAPAETISFQVGGLAISSTAETLTTTTGSVNLSVTVYGTGTVAWASDTPANADVSTASGTTTTVTGVATGTANITATQTPTVTDGSDGFLYLSATPTATCVVTVP
ncbi:MAG: hypothetical protein IJG07_00425 [Prevotella sp.]|nr:hypothetical protein [Prevotella sp.]